MRTLNKIFWDYFIDIMSGGPTGYLAQLRIGLDEAPLNANSLTWIDRLRKEDVVERSGPTSPTNQELSQHINYFEKLENFNLTDAEFKRLMRRDPRTVHLHTSPLTLKVIQAMKTRGVSGIPVIISSHCPESNGKEMADQYRNLGLDEGLADRFELAVRKVEELAFQQADVWVFPSVEALEPYVQTIPKFSEWMKGKDVRYVATGAKPARRSKGDNPLHKKIPALDQHHVISFVGRHNAVKGYDKFIEAGLKVLEADEKAIIIVAGSESPEFPAPIHPRWVELGWYPNPGDIFEVSDVYVLPNRMTYYDLVLIEALSTGVRIVASATGGNLSVYAMTKGVISLFDDTTEDLVKKILALLLSDKETLQSREERVRLNYTKKFTPKIFAERYNRLIESIHADYNNSAPKRS